MLRGGYIKYVANGIFSLFAPLKRMTQKIEGIIRDEMDAIDGQEVLFPVVLPGALWEKSGRYTSVGSELVRLKDRNGSPLVLGMTHEEAAVHLAREYGSSHLKYPFMIYQIQTKFRDEARPRGGLIRVREFTMKDAYSFHASQADLEQYYDKCYHAYERIFSRVGLPEVITVASDSGMMGGSISHEYMLLSAVGEDSIAICSDCGYRANMEAAPCIIENQVPLSVHGLNLVHTPNIRTIDDVCGFLQVTPAQTCKAVVYQKNASDEYVVVFLRGDLDVNETKLTHYLGEEVHPGFIADNGGLTAGFLGPYQLVGTAVVLFDRSLMGASNLVCGANTVDHHYTGLSLPRDCGGVAYHDFAKIADGGICPQCGKQAIAISRGIEVGNIFQLGTKYTKAMGMQYQDEDGTLQYPLMGCYGIGIGRLAASVCEAHHDAFGPIWPMAIAPWQVHLCCMRADAPDVKICADSLYDALQAQDIEVLYDDRAVSAGVMFSDADLMGIPLRVIISPRTLKEGCCEITSRDKAIHQKAPLSTALDEIKLLIHRLLHEKC